LIVDAHAHTRALLTQVLRAIGSPQVRAARKPSEAIAAAIYFAPTIMLIDWDQSAANEDGIGFTKRVRRGETPFPRDVAIILFSSRAGRGDVEAARMAGVDEFVIRPFSTATVVDRLKSAIFDRRPFVEGARYLGPCRRRKLVINFPTARRLTDADRSDARNEEDEVAKAIARSHIASVIDVTRAVDRKRIQEIHKVADDILSIAANIDDKSLATAAASMRRYIEGVGASPRFDPEVIGAHVDAMMQILSLPSMQNELRAEVTRALEKLVAKRVRAAAHAN